MSVRTAAKFTSVTVALVAVMLTAGVVFASTVFLHEPHRNTTSSCPGSGTVTWHFVLNNLDPGTPALTLNAEFDDAGVLTDVGTPVGNGQTQHFFIDTPGNDTLINAWVDVGTQSETPKLVLSHIACGPPAPPSVVIDKTGDELSKIGDQVTYNYKITNTGGWPLTLVSITDDKVGNLLAAATAAGCDELAVGTFCQFSVNFTIPSGAADPFVNTVTVVYDHAAPPPDDANVTDSDSHSTNLFQPAVEVIKGGPAEAHVGDTITYTFAITNLSSADSPNLILDSVSDNVLGSLTAIATAAGCDVLTAAETCNFTKDYLIPMGTSSPLVNTVTVHYHPQGFPNDITDTDSHSVIVRGAEGCTPGYWKNHPASWGPTGYAPSNTLESVFNVPDGFGIDNNTLIQALGYQGGTGTLGGAKILLRAGVAALLNAAHPDVDYALTTTEVINQVNAALASGSRSTMLALAAQLDAANNSDCPLN